MFAVETRASWLVSSCIALGITLLITAATSRADGLFYQLPPDGGYVKFDVEMQGGTGDSGQKASGSLTMSSVGEVEADDQPCRWLEVKLVMKVDEDEQTIIAKMLIPKEHLKRGKYPWLNFKKAWLKMGDNDLKEITDVVGNDAGPLPAFLSGPLSDEKELPPIEIDSSLGRLLCEGQTGNLMINDGSQQVHIEIENRLNEKAPFGVVTSMMSFRVVRDDEERETGILKFTLVDAGKDANSELPVSTE